MRGFGDPEFFGDRVDRFRNVATALAPGGLFAVERFVRDLTEFDRDQRVATRAPTEDAVDMEFLPHDPVEQTVAYQRVTFDAHGTTLRPLRPRSAAGAPPCGSSAWPGWAGPHAGPCPRGT